MAKLAIQEKELPRDRIHHRHAVFFAGMGEFHTFWGLNYEPGIENLDNARQDLSLAGMRWLEKQGDQEAAALACLAACSAIHGDDAVGSKYRLLEHVGVSVVSGPHDESCRSDCECAASWGACGFRGAGGHHGCRSSERTPLGDPGARACFSMHSALCAPVTEHGRTGTGGV